MTDLSVVERLISGMVFDLLQSTVVASEFPLMEAGLDSVSSTELTNALVSRLETELPSTLLFDHPNIASVAQFVASTLPPPDASELEVKSDAIVKVELSRTPIERGAERPESSLDSRFAILLPGSYSSSSALAQLAVCGLVANSTIPIARTMAVNTANTAAMYGAFAIRGAFRSNAGAFGISFAEAKVMDPQSSLILESAYTTLHVPNDCRAALSNTPVGFFLGVGGSSAFAPGTTAGKKRTSAPSVYEGTAHALSVLSGRVSYTLGLTGPCFSVDTACSSSLVAAHAGASALLQSECPRAVMTGAGLLSTAVTVKFSAAGMLSALGRCHTMDRRGDGYCRGEGCGSFSLTSDVGTVYLVSAVQQDGPSASLTAPNGTSQ